jgi:hypothetical protein
MRNERRREQALEASRRFVKRQAMEIALRATFSGGPAARDARRRRSAPSAVEHRWLAHPLRDNCGNLSLCHSALCITGAAMQHMYAGWTDHHDVDIVSRSSPSEEY